MSIPTDLRDVALTFECPYCAHPLVRKGSWFKVIGHYTCEKCQSRVRIGYPDKLRLFDHYKRSVGNHAR